MLFATLPLPTAYALAVAIATFSGVAFAFGFGRLQRLSRAASLILALAYLTSHPFITLVTGLSYVNGFSMLPGVLFAISGLARATSIRARIGWFVLGTAVLSVGLLAGFPQTVLYGGLLAAAFAIFLDVTARRWFVIPALFGMVVIAGLFALPQLLSTYDAARISVRAFTAYTAESSRIASPLAILSFVLPQGALANFPFTKPLALYIGALPLVLAIIGMTFRERTTRFFCWSFVFIALMALHLPIVSLINTHLPILSHISNVNRWPLIGSFAFAYLAGSGFDRWRVTGRGWYDERRGRMVLRLFALVSLFTVAGMLLVWMSVFFLTTHPAFQGVLLDRLIAHRSLRFPLEHYRAVFSDMFNGLAAALSFRNVGFWLLVLMVPAAYGVLVVGRRSFFASRMTGIVLGITALNVLLVQSVSLGDLVSRRIIEEDPLVIRAIKSREPDPHAYRIFPLLVGDGIFHTVAGRQLKRADLAEIDREALSLNANVLFGVDSATGDEVLRTIRQNLLFETVINPFNLHAFDLEAARRGGRLDQIFNAEVLRPVTVEEKMRDFNSRLALVSMMNAKYVISLFPIPHSPLREIHLGNNPYLGAPIHVYENPQALPRLYLARQPIFWEKSERELLLAMAATVDFKEQTYLECAECAAADATRGAGTVEVLHYGNGEIAATVRGSGGWLVFSETHMPGWAARVDGASAPLVTANYIYQAVRVPPGDHRVDFVYRGSWERLKERIYETVAEKT